MIPIDIHRDVEIFLDMPVIRTDTENFVSPIKYTAEILIFCQSEWNFVSQIIRSDTFRHHCIQVSRSKVKVKGHASLLHLVQLITQERFVHDDKMIPIDIQVSRSRSKLMPVYFTLCNG